MAGESTHEQTLDLNMYLNGLYGYAFVLSRNSTQAEDLVQETCLQAIRAKRTLRPDSNVKSWLFTILRNLVQSAPAPAYCTHDGELDLEASEPRDTTPDPHAVYADKVDREQYGRQFSSCPWNFEKS